MKPDTDNKIPPQILDQLKLRMTELQTAMLAEDPQMPPYLKESHKLLISYPETAHLLDDTEIAQLIKAAEAHMQTEIIKAVAKKSTSRTKVSDASVDDL